jgi:hypothetical protein
MENDELQTLREHFIRFAEQDGRDVLLYAAMARIVADDDALRALLLEAMPMERKPVLLFACLHERLLAGADHPLAAYYASLGGTQAPDAALAGCLRDFVHQQREPLVALLRTRRTQTNEVGRSAVLWAALQHLAGLSARNELALLDFGCSAGLNLGVDEFGFDDGEGGYGVRDAALRLPIQWRGRRPSMLAEPARWRLAARVGADLDPIDPGHPGQARWLQACLWPGDGTRRERLQQALAAAAQRRDPLLRGEDGLARLADHALPPGALPVLFNSWVLAYFDDAAWQHHRERALALVTDRGWAWISAEARSRSPLANPPAVPDGESAGSASLWSLHWRDAEGQVREQALAWSHPHGRWAAWLA